MDRFPIQELPKKKFPKTLREIPQPPKQLFYRGKLPDWRSTFLCVVGSRRYTQYGKEACEHLIRGLGGYNVTIVSGLALGIDGIAHRAALQVGLPVIAFPGSGLGKSVIYPRTHYALAEEILDANGTLMSEYEADFKATLWTFPQRNRLMAGISRATLLVEAAPDSGTLITARLCTEYNRDLLVVPGSIFSENSHGPHAFLKVGGIPITSPQELVEALGLVPKARKEIIANCSPEEQVVLDILQEPLSRDEIILGSGLPAHEITPLLTALELRGVIEEREGKLRVAK